MIVFMTVPFNVQSSSCKIVLFNDKEPMLTIMTCKTSVDITFKS